MAVEGVLERVELPLAGERLDGRQLRPLRLDGEEQAGADRHPIEEDGAGAADAVLAPQPGAGEERPLADEVGEGGARLDGGGEGAAVDPEPDLPHATASPSRASARVATTPTRWRR